VCERGGDIAAGRDIRVPEPAASTTSAADDFGAQALRVTTLFRGVDFLSFSIIKSAFACGA
jgi:hypothetical protein